MELNTNELTEARRVIARALEEDLGYGPDVTTMATVPADARTASMVTREPGVIAGVDIALLVLDEVLGPDGCRVKHRVDDGARLEAGAAALIVEAPTQSSDRRAHHAEPGVSPVGHRDDDGRVGRRRGRHEAKIRDTRKTLPGLRALQKSAVGSAVASSTAWVSAMRR